MSAVKCPHCGSRLTDLWDLDWSNGRTSVDTYCGHCDKPITIRQEVTVEYTAHILEAPRITREEFDKLVDKIRSA